MGEVREAKGNRTRSATDEVCKRDHFGIRLVKSSEGETVIEIQDKQ